MPTGKAMPSGFVRCAMRVEAPQAETKNPSLTGRYPITEAIMRMLNRTVPNDLLGRTFADLIAEAMIKQAIKGNIRAVREILDSVEGKVPKPREQRIEQDERPNNVTVIWPDRPKSTTIATTAS